MTVLYCDYLSARYIKLLVLFMSDTYFRVNSCSIIACKSRKSLLETGTIFEVEVSASCLESRKT